MLPFAMLVCLAACQETAPAIDTTKANPPALLDEICQNLETQHKNGRLRKLKELNLTITTYRGGVTVTGRAESPDEARAIMDAVSGAKGVGMITLQLGIGREPAPLPAPVASPSCPQFPEQFWGSRHVKLDWDDGPWNLDFKSIPQSRKLNVPPKSAPVEQKPRTVPPL